VTSLQCQPETSGAPRVLTPPNVAPGVAQVVKAVAPSVVDITAVRHVPTAAPSATLGRAPWYDPGGAEELRKNGSGFVVDEKGHIVTNAHVVDQAEAVYVALADGRRFTARLVTKDEPLDLAILELPVAPSSLEVASLGSSATLQVGDYVVALGNPFGLGETVTMGIVSAKERALPASSRVGLLQTDAAFNPGNSGGPLFDLAGRVVGVSTTTLERSQGIGFAIPIDEVKKELPRLLADGADRGAATTSGARR
jgi:serine protease Do